MPDDSQFPKIYDSTLVEDSIYDAWMKSGYFTPENLPNLDNRKESFCISLPPPNVTGTLHIGHAVMLAIEDAMIRFARMNGKRALWVPGTDHAAIATQTKVEKLLIKEGIKDPCRELGREAFLERVRAFATQSHDTIVNQLKKIGVSIDWSREAYTLDEKRTLAVRTAFKRMYDDGLIYRDYKVVNWDPVGKTTVSDEEVEHKDAKAILYTFKYNKDFPIPIATTRPETKVGDVAVAVHPNGKWKKFVGQEFSGVEFAGTKLNIKIIADNEVDPEFGTGALGVTPAHSVIDAEIASRHGLQMIHVIDEDARMNTQAGELVSGLSTIDARKKIVEWLNENKLIISQLEVDQSISVAQRSGGVIEPLPKSQWFIDVNKEFAFKQSKEHPIAGLKDGQRVTLKQLMRHAVESKSIDILPDRFEKVYYHWIDNLRDWCISRQIWFGHQIPVWKKGEEIYVGVDAPSDNGWEQDSDTLDTWFSSGLWTFSTLGWPNENSEDLKLYHPTAVMETGYDILFFWVARMILMSTYLLGEVPFKTVYLHGLVRDEQGRKMSKSLGNAVDPLDSISKYGADAMRLAMMIGQTPGNDTKLSDEKIASYRNFTNKLWNISRFVFMSVDKIHLVEEAPKPETIADEWILSRYNDVVKRATKHYEKYEYSLLGELLRDFTWGEFADWYLEIAKVQEKNSIKSTDEILLYVLGGLLKLWHPLMPFVTEELYKQFDNGMLIIANWPQVKARKRNEKVKNFEKLRNVITELRNIRSQYKIAYSTPIDIIISGATNLEEYQDVISQMVKTGKIEWKQNVSKPKSALTVMVDDIVLYILLDNVVDLHKERDRICAELIEVENYIALMNKKLENKEFIKNAPKKVIDAERERLSCAIERRDALNIEIEKLKI
jgi:valyl-tRNA synthetase